MTTNSEQLRTDFEAWWKDRQVAVSIKEDAFAAYQAGQAALRDKELQADTDRSNSVINHAIRLDEERGY